MIRLDQIKNRWVLFGAILMAGCDTMPAGTMLGEPVQTPIPPGIYTGRLTGVSRSYNSAGALVGELPLDTPLTQTFDGFGLPLFGGNVQAVVGAVYEFALGDSTGSATISSVNVSGNRLAIGTNISSTSNPDDIISGSATYTYDFVSPKTVDYTSSVFLGETTPQGFFTVIGEGSAQLIGS